MGQEKIEIERENVYVYVGWNREEEEKCNDCVN
jgi:hypothetical protein